MTTTTDSSPMKTYVVAEAASTTLVDGFGERFDVSFTKGTHTPKSEHEEQSLEHLVQIGAATTATTGKAPAADKEKDPDE